MYHSHWIGIIISIATLLIPLVSGHSQLMINTPSTVFYVTTGTTQDHFSGFTCTISGGIQTGDFLYLNYAGYTSSWVSPTLTVTKSGTTSADHGTITTVLNSVVYYTTSTDKSVRTVSYTLTLYAKSYGGHYYEHVFDYVGGWSGAMSVCSGRTVQGKTGYGAVVTSSGEQSFLVSTFSSPNVDGWTSASDAAVEGTWRWTAGPENGVAFWINGVCQTYCVWNAAQPDDGGGNEDCMELWSVASGNWNDLPCTTATVSPYCEFGGLGSDTAPTYSLSGSTTMQYNTPVNYVNHDNIIFSVTPITTADNYAGITAIVEGNAQTGDELRLSPIAGWTITWTAATFMLKVTAPSLQSAFVMSGVVNQIKFYTTSYSTLTRTVTYTMMPSSNQMVYATASGHFYESVPVATDWNTAKTNCAGRTLQGKQGYLPTFTSAAEYAAFATITTGSGWLGGNDAAAEGTWKWMTGPENGQTFYTGASPTGTCSMYCNWNTGEPNNAGGAENYLQAWSGGKWNDLPVSSGAITVYFCEYGDMPGDPVPSYPMGGSATWAYAPIYPRPLMEYYIFDGITTPVTSTLMGGFTVTIESNFVSKRDELRFSNGCCTSSFDVNAGILTVSTSSTVSIADAWTYLRLVRFYTTSRSNTKRRISFSFKVGTSTTIFYSTNGHFYENVAAPGISWTNAKAACQARSIQGKTGYLATLTSAGEFAYFYQIVSGYGWMGGSDAASEGVWQWVTGPETGTTFYTGVSPTGTCNTWCNWASGEPNNSGGENCLHALANGQWNDFADGNTGCVGYFCEYGGLGGDVYPPPFTVTGAYEVIPTYTRTHTITITDSETREMPSVTWKTKSHSISYSPTREKRSKSTTMSIDLTVTVSRSLSQSETINKTRTITRTSERTITTTKTLTDDYSPTESETPSIPLIPQVPLPMKRRRLVTTLAGDASALGYVNGVGSAARFNGMQGIAVGRYGVYVSDTTNNRIRLVSFPAGILYSGSANVFAGSGTAATVDGTGVSAKFNSPVGLSIDSNRNIFVCEPTSTKIRKITPAGVVTTLVAAGYFTTPWGNAIDANGNLIVCDKGTHLIKQVTMAGSVSTIAGTTQGYTDGSALSAAQFNAPTYLAADMENNDYYVSDTNNHRIRRIQNSVVSTVAGTGTAGSTNGRALTSQLNAPNGIVVGPRGAVYIAEYGGYQIRKLQNGWLSTVAGTAGVNANVDGTMVTATLGAPVGLALSPNQRDLYVTCGGAAIRQIYLPLNYTKTSSFTKLVVKDVRLRHLPIRKKRRVDLLAGSVGTSAFADGYRTAARFDGMINLLTTNEGIYLPDYNNCRIRLVTYSGMVTTFAGSGTCASVDGTGTGAQFNKPVAIVKDASFFYVTDYFGGKVRKITSSGVVTTIATVSGVYGMTIDKTLTTLYICDYNNHYIKQLVIATTTLSSFAGNGVGALTNGAYGSASFKNPAAIMFDNYGVLFVVDLSNHAIRKLTGGQVTTFAGTGVAGYTNGPTATAQFNQPSGITFDRNNVMYITEITNARLRMISNGWVSTIGLTGTSANVDGWLSSTASVLNVLGLSFDKQENFLYICGQTAVRRVYWALNRTMSASRTFSPGDNTLTTSMTKEFTTTRTTTESMSDTVSDEESVTAKTDTPKASQTLSRTMTVSNTPSQSVTGRTRTPDRTFTTTWTETASRSVTKDHTDTRPTVTSDFSPSRTVKEHTFSPTKDKSATRSESSDITLSETITLGEHSVTKTWTDDYTKTLRVTRTVSRTPTPSQTDTRTQDKTSTPSESKEHTLSYKSLSVDATLSTTLSVTNSFTRNEHSQTRSVTADLTLSTSPSLSETFTDGISQTRSVTPDQTLSQTHSMSDTSTQDITLSQTFTMDVTNDPTVTATQSGTDDQTPHRTTSAKLPTRTRFTPDHSVTRGTGTELRKTMSVSPLSRSMTHERTVSSSDNDSVVLTPPPSTAILKTTPPPTTSTPSPPSSEPPTPAPPRTTVPPTTSPPTPVMTPSPTPTPRPPAITAPPTAPPHTLVPTQAPSRTPRPVPTYPPKSNPDTEAPEPTEGSKQETNNEAPDGGTHAPSSNTDSKKETSAPEPYHTTSSAPQNAFNAFFMGSDSETQWVLWAVVGGIALGLVVFSGWYLKCRNGGRPHQVLVEVDLPPAPPIVKTRHHRVLRRLFPHVERDWVDKADVDFESPKGGGGDPWERENIGLTDYQPEDLSFDGPGNNFVPRHRAIVGS